MTTVNSLAPNGADIRFVDADNSETLPYEIEEWKEDDTSIIWVKVPNIPKDEPGVDSDYIWMYYGNPDASDNQEPENVWSNNYAMVQHLEETSGHHIDSTSNSNDSTSENVTRQGADIGQIDGADEFDGTDSVVIPDNINSSLDITDTITVEAWVKGSVSVAAWKSPTGYTDGSWENEEMAFDENTATAAECGTEAEVWSSYLELLISPAITCDKIRLYLNQSIDDWNGLGIDVYDDAWHNIYQWTYPGPGWHIFNIPAGAKTVSKARVQGRSIYGEDMYICEFDFHQPGTYWTTPQTSSSSNSYWSPLVAVRDDKMDTYAESEVGVGEWSFPLYIGFNAYTLCKSVRFWMDYSNGDLSRIVISADIGGEWKTIWDGPCEWGKWWDIDLDPTGWGNPVLVKQIRIEFYNSHDDENSMVYVYECDFSEYPVPNQIKKGSAYGIGRDTANALGTINNNTISTPISAGWQHIVLTYDGAEQKLYVNSVLKASQPLSGEINTNLDDLIIGSGFVGIIDEVRISDIARSDSWIKARYNSMIDNFINYGDEEAIGVIIDPPLRNYVMDGSSVGRELARISGFSNPCSSIC